MATRTHYVRRIGARLSVAALFALALLPASAAADWASRPTRIGGLTVPARATPTGVELSRGGGLFATRFWAGVNLGATIPGQKKPW